MSYGFEAAERKSLQEPSAHEDCHCKNCHRWHLDNNYVKDNAKNCPDLFPCCVEEMENQ